MDNEHDEHEQHDDERELWRPEDADPAELVETPDAEPSSDATNDDDDDDDDDLARLPGNAPCEAP